MQPSVADVVASFVRPPRSELGAQLKAPPPTSSLSFEDPEQERQHHLARLCHHAARRLPRAAISRILDGSIPGSSELLRDSERSRKAATAISAHAGSDGSSLQPHFSTLANLADLAMSGLLDVSCRPIHIFEQQLGPALVSSYLDWERARGFVDGAVGAAPSALSHLRFARDHLGLDAPDLESSIVTSAASKSLNVGAEVPQARHRGSIPCRVQAGREACANERGGQGPAESSEVVWVWQCCRIIALSFGLRGKEMRTARVEDASCTDTLISISFHPKGSPSKPRITAYRHAFGVLGPYLWWPRFRVRMSASLSLTPGFNAGSTKGGIFRATFLRSTLVAKGSTSAVDLLSMPLYGISREQVDQLDLSEHSDHGTLNDGICSYAARPELGMDVHTDCLIAGHWLGSAPTAGAEGRDSVRSRTERTAAERSRLHAQAQSLAMAARYQDGAPAIAGPDVWWRFIRFSFYAIREGGLSWQDLDPTAGWSVGRLWGVQNHSSASPVTLAAYPPFPPQPS